MTLDLLSADAPNWSGIFSVGWLWEWVVWSGDALAAVFTFVVLIFNVVLMVQARRQRKEQNREFDQGRRDFAEQMLKVAEANRLASHAHDLAQRDRYDNFAPRVSTILTLAVNRESERIDRPAGPIPVDLDGEVTIGREGLGNYAVHLTFIVKIYNHGEVSVIYDLREAPGITASTYGPRTILPTHSVAIYLRVYRTALEWRRQPDVKFAYRADVNDPWNTVCDVHHFTREYCGIEILDDGGLKLLTPDFEADELAKVDRYYTKLGEEPPSLSSVV